MTDIINNQLAATLRQKEEVTEAGRELQPLRLPIILRQMIVSRGNLLPMTIRLWILLKMVFVLDPR